MPAVNNLGVNKGITPFLPAILRSFSYMANKNIPLMIFSQKFVLISCVK